MRRGEPFRDQITQEMLNKAWQLKNKRFSDKDIARRIGIGFRCYHTHKAVFLKHYAKMTRQSEKLSRKIAGRQRSKTFEKMRMAAIELAKLGEARYAIACQLGIPESTLRAWMSSDEVFDHEMRTAKDKADHLVIKSLLRRATGYTTKKKMTVSTIDSKQRKSVVTTEYQQTMAPDVNAMKLWLVNRKEWVTDSTGKMVDEDERNVEYDVREKLYSGDESED